MWLHNVFTGFLNSILPEVCAVCHKNYVAIQQPLCRICLGSITIISMKDRCSVCGHCLLGRDCVSCAKRKIFFHKSVFLFSYQGTTRILLQMAKFRKRRMAQKYILYYMKHHFGALHKLIEEYNSDILLLNMCSSKKLLYQLVKRIATHHKVPHISIFKKVNLAIQNKFLHEEERYLQVEKNMELNVRYIEQLKQYRAFLIIDDVWTTGATLNYAAKLLTERGICESNIYVCSLFYRERRQDTIKA